MALADFSIIKPSNTEHAQTQTHTKQQKLEESLIDFIGSKAMMQFFVRWSLDISSKGFCASSVNSRGAQNIACAVGARRRWWG